MQQVRRIFCLALPHCPALEILIRHFLFLLQFRVACRSWSRGFYCMVNAVNFQRTRSDFEPDLRLAS